MPLADVVLIYENPPLPQDEMSQRILGRLRAGAANSKPDRDSPGYLLVRYTVDGSFAGETWHQTIEDAKSQAAVEYREALGNWQQTSVPPDDAAQHALDEIRRAG